MIESIKMCIIVKIHLLLKGGLWVGMVWLRFLDQIIGGMQDGKGWEELVLKHLHVTEGLHLTT